jgi:hypothetical protein
LGEPGRRCLKKGVASDRALDTRRLWTSSRVVLDLAAKAFVSTCVAIRPSGTDRRPKGPVGVCVCMIFHLPLGKRNLLTGTARLPNGTLDCDSRKCDSLGVKLREGLPDAVSGAFFFCSGLISCFLTVS